MSAAPLPPNEAARLAQLRRLELLDTAPEETFDEITALASRLCGTPIALMSLVDEDRQWFKSRVGLEAAQTPRDVAFCAHAILTPSDLFEVPDAQADARFAGNPLVTGAPDIRFYAATPLVAPSGEALGTLCVIDRQPRRLTDDQRAALSALGRAVSSQLGLRLAAKELREQLVTVERSRQQLAAQQALLDVLARHASVNAAAPDLAQAFGTALKLDASSLWLATAGGERLSCAGAWVRDERFAAFREATRGRTFARGEGLPGRVLERAAAVVSPRLADDDNFPRRPVARGCGLKVGFGVPVLGEAGVLGVLEVFGEEEREPTAEQLATLELLGRQLGLALEREGARASVVSSQERTQSIVDAALDCIVAIDRDGRITEWNPAAERTFGWTRTQAIGRLMGELIVPQRLRAAHDAGLKRYLDTQQPRIVGSRLEIAALRSDGTEFTVELSLARTSGSGPFEVTAFLRDITERKRTEAALRRAKEEAEAANRAKSDFLAVMSHEIRTPMNAILGMTELALEQAVDGDQRELLGTAHANAESLLGLVNEILDDSKITAGQMEVVRQPCDPAELAESVVEALAVRAHKAGLELVCDVSPSVPATLLADPQRLRQVLLNLVGNALKFTPHGMVDVALLTEPGPAGTPELHVRVRDTGPGIPLELQPRIFDRFFQVDSSLSRGAAGTGLGLSITRSLVELMHGRIWVESTPGHGTTFHAAIPAETVAPGAGPTFRLTHVLFIAPPGRARDAAARALAACVASVQCCADVAEAARVPLRGGEVVIVDDVLGPGAAEAVARWRKDGGLELHLVSLGVRHGEVSGFEFLARPVTRRRVRSLLGRLFGLEPAQAAKRPAPATRPARVLVLDDQPDNLAFASRSLARDGHVVEIARSGAEALELARKRRFDLVFTDLEMPGMDGYAFTRAFRTLEAQGKGRTPVLALTAHAFAGVREQCTAAGMDDVVTKPVKSETLRAKVQEWGDLRPVVLAVDDTPDALELVRRFLRSEPVRVLTAPSGEEALELLERERVSMLLLDMSMPGMDGYATARAVRQRPEWRELPLFALTGFDGAEEERRCLDAGCSGVLHKPVSRERLREAVRDACGLSHPAPPPPAEAGPRVVEVDADIVDLVPGYLAARRADVGRLRERLRDGDYRAIEALGHHLAGSGAAYGFAPISDIGSRLETAAQAHAREIVERSVEALDVFVRDVRWVPRRQTPLPAA